jgi:protein-L-isoaspartate(D-aspartate) O-methyltransferase
MTRGPSKGLVSPQGFARARTATAKEAAASPAPALASAKQRQTMVARLKQQGITDPRVLAAMNAVPRHAFVDAAFASRAYEDTALPIGQQQTISQPYIVARMLELALGAPSGHRTWLEIGTGCGYEAAVMAQLANDVISIERIKSLADRARANVRPLRIPNLRLLYGDGLAGFPAHAPYDAIVIAAAGLQLPDSLLAQLAIGGRVVAPMVRAGHGPAQEQWLTLIERTGPQVYARNVLEQVNFVPLLAGTQ